VEDCIGPYANGTLDKTKIADLLKSAQISIAVGSTYKLRRLTKATMESAMKFAIDNRVVDDLEIYIWINHLHFRQGLNFLDWENDMSNMAFATTAALTAPMPWAVAPPAVPASNAMLPHQAEVEQEEIENQFWGLEQEKLEKETHKIEEKLQEGMRSENDMPDTVFETTAAPVPSASAPPAVSTNNSIWQHQEKVKQQKMENQFCGLEQERHAIEEKLEEGMGRENDVSGMAFDTTVAPAAPVPPTVAPPAVASRLWQSLTETRPLHIEQEKNAKPKSQDKLTKKMRLRLKQEKKEKRKRPLHIEQERMQNPRVRISLRRRCAYA